MSAFLSGLDSSRFEGSERSAAVGESLPATEQARRFAGSTVRKITRGMWAFDTLNDVLLLQMLPSLPVLVGTMLLLGWHWPVLGLVMAIGAVAYVAMTIVLATRWASPAATLSNAWDTKLGGRLSDAIGSNAVVKAFGAVQTVCRGTTRLSKMADGQHVGPGHISKVFGALGTRPGPTRHRVSRRGGSDRGPAIRRGKSTDSIPLGIQLCPGLHAALHRQRGIACELVGPFIVGVAGMALHPDPFDAVRLGGGE
jgi:hypothetical protein